MIGNIIELWESANIRMMNQFCQIALHANDDFIGMIVYTHKEMDASGSQASRACESVKLHQEMPEHPAAVSQQDHLHQYNKQMCQPQVPLNQLHDPMHQTSVRKRKTAL
jgi:hypothetical protein